MTEPGVTDQRASARAGLDPARGRPAEVVAAVAAAEERLADLVARAGPGAAEQETANLVGGLLSAARARGAAGTIEIMLRFPLLVHAAEAGDPGGGNSAAVVHVLWWTAARYLDDLADAEPAARGYAGGPHQGVLAALCAGTQLPLRVLGAAPVDDGVRMSLVTELSRCWWDATGGQLFDYTAQPGDVTPAQVLHGYGGKTGAPYAMAAAMAARLAGATETRVDLWREAGRRFGVLRQLVNDRKDLVTGRDEDLRNGTATYLVTSFLATADAGTLALHAAAASSDVARDEFTRRMLTAAGGFSADVDALVGRLHQELDDLGGHPAYTGALHDLLDEAMAIFPLPAPGAER